MKKVLYFLLILFLFPTIVFAGGSSDDDSMGVSHMNINCVYEQQSPVAMQHGKYNGNGTYINIEFGGIDDTSTSGTFFTYSFGKLLSDNKFEKNYEYTFASGGKTGGRWLNYNKAYGSEYWLQAWWSNQMRDDKLNTLPASKIQEKADNGEFCPQQVIIVQTKEDSKYYFVSARDNKDRVASSNALSKSGKYKNEKLYYFTGTSIAISNINQETLEDTNAEEKVEESKQNITNYCDKNSASYDEKKCTESKIVAGATEETVEDIVSYNNNVDYELPGIALGKITCEDLFKNGDDYNATHKLLASTLRFMQYLGIILATILSVVDFIKVVPTNDKDALNKAAKKSVTRLVIAIVIFFVPVILNFILGLVGFNNPTCRLL